MLRNGFETRLAAHQNSIDIFKDDWGSAFPATTGLQAGASNNFEDVRVPWAAAILGGLNGRSVVELGPFEAYNTWQLQVAGAASVLAIEGSQINFLKCLVVKNILGLNATFMHGDFIAFLERTGSRYDICWASGVLYHMTDPLSLLRGIRKVSDIAFIWTHYFDEAALRASNSIEPFQAERNIRIDAFDREITLHYRRYPQYAGSFFSGGTEPYSYWIEREDILFLIRGLGYRRIEIGIDNPAHPSGPAFFFVARA